MNKRKNIWAYFIARFCMLIFPFFILPGTFAQTILPFTYTGSAQTFTIPCGVDTIHVKAWGAGGSGGGADSYGGAVGGAGAFVESDILVTPGQVLTVIVGGGAGPGTGCVACSGGGPSGWGNGVVDGGRGGNAGCSPCSGGGGGGGGGAAIYNGGTALLVAAGGGGGSGGGQFSSGGAGGAGGENGNPSPGSCAAVGIAGAAAGGNGNQGQDKGGGDGAGGGGGGGGYNGGSGGSFPPSCDCGGCGGAGGMSYSAGVNTTIINGSGQTPGNSSDPGLPSGVAVGGGTSTKGGDGYIIVTYFGGPPEADFSSTTVCSTIATEFTNNSITSDGTITSVSWDYGNGSPLDTVYSPDYIYPAAGNYNVTLIVNNNYGCADTITKPVQVYYKPSASFAYGDVCFGDSADFTNTSTIDPGGTIAGYLWKFDDGTTSTLQSPGHLYATGTYSPVLIVTSANMCVDSVTHTLNTFDPPTSAFTTGNTCLFDSAEFTNASVNPTMGTLASWYWNFDDGTPVNSSTWSPSHLYSVPGDYDVMLITHSSNMGCADTLTVTVTVYPMPVADFDAADVCLNEASAFTDASSVSSGTIAFWQWDFGDGTPVSGLQDPGHTYAAPGTYTVTLTVTSANGCADTVSKTHIVHPLPVAEFSTSNVCDGSLAQFTNMSSITGPDIIQLNLWNFGDASTLSSPDASHLYSGPAGYEVQLLVVSDFGCADSITHEIVINPNPAVEFNSTVIDGCEPLCITLTDESTIVSGSNTGWFWDMGDGGPVNISEDLQYCFENYDPFMPVTYSPTLTVASDSGCISVLTKDNYITVFPAPEAGFIVEPTTVSTINPVVSLTDFSLGANTWLWNFGDSDTSNLSNPLTHTYSDTGTFQIMLITSTQYGCSDTAYQTVIVEPEFILYVPNAFTPNGDGINDFFICKTMFYTEFQMSIYDRWGNMLYKTESIDKPWDGKANGGANLAQMDVYIYSIQVTDLKRKVHTYRGTVSLLK
jgi:gliding motility-associated-like protein